MLERAVPAGRHAPPRPNPAEYPVIERRKRIAIVTTPADEPVQTPADEPVQTPAQGPAQEPAQEPAQGRPKDRRGRCRQAATQPVSRRIADELGVRESQVAAAVELLDGGATVPFIARYRKEVTGDAGRRAAPHAGGTAPLPARAGRAAGRDPGVDPRAGQARRRARAADHGRRFQGPAGGHLPALQAEAPHQGADRPRSRPGAAGRPAAVRAEPAIPQQEAAAYVDPDRGVADARPPWTGPAPSWWSASPRTPT